MKRPDPQLDLVLERVLDVPVDRVWAAWTTPKHLMKWFCPPPWKVTQCQIDLRPGGIFRTLMCGPEGEEMPHVGCYLEVIKNKRLVWTDALLSGYRPSPKPFITAIITMEPRGKKTKYTAIAQHKDEATRAEHEKMGFAEGWGTATDQLVAVANTIKRK
jgi:uncharacterized protein YndB with AHSA1/START domain